VALDLPQSHLNAPMKTATKLLHLIWAGMWGFFLLVMSLPEIDTEPYLGMLSLFALVWIAFAVGLVSNRAWGWYGSFVCCVFLMFGLFYCVWMDVAIMRDEGKKLFFKYDSVFFYEQMASAVSAVVIVGMLLHARRYFLREPERI
jgi:hypothetical protein